MKLFRALPLLIATAVASVLLLSNRSGLPQEARKATSPNEFTFVQMCDTQLGMGGYDHDVKNFELAVEQINEMAPDFVLICGDLVGKANDKSIAGFNRIKSGFKIPCHCAAGNHDVENKPTAASLKNYRKKIGKDYFVVEHKGYTFVVANTQLWKAPLKGESEKHDAWFKAASTTAKQKNSPVVVVTHYPLFVKAPDEKESYYNIEPAKRKELLDLFETNGVVAMLAGHTHKFIENDYKGIQMVNGETTSKNFDKRPLGFRKWTNPLSPPCIPPNPGFRDLSAKSKFLAARFSRHLSRRVTKNLRINVINLHQADQKKDHLSVILFRKQRNESRSQEFSGRRKIARAGAVRHGKGRKAAVGHDRV